MKKFENFHLPPEFLNAISGKNRGRKVPGKSSIATLFNSSTIFVATFLATVALASGILAVYLFPRPANSAISPPAATQPRSVKLAQATATTSVAGTVPLAGSIAPTKTAETVVPRQSGDDLNPYAKPTPRPLVGKTKSVPKIARPASVTQPKTAPAPAPAISKTDDRLKQLTDDVVARLKNLKREEQNKDASNLLPATNDLRRSIAELVSQASARGKSNAYVQSLIDNAIAGSDAVPAALAGPDGKLDTRLLLAFVLAKPDIAKVGNSDASYLTALENESSAINRQSRQAGQTGARFVIVKKGDNLSKLALKFYGDPFAYAKIFAANRKLLANANTLSIGQRLRIPRLIGPGPGTMR